VDDADKELIGRLAGAGLESSAEIVKAVLGLFGNAVQAIGAAAISVDPLQFFFVAYTALLALVYLDTTSPYKEVIAHLHLHGLIGQLHLPGTSGQDIRHFIDCVNNDIQKIQAAGLPVPAQLYQLRDSSNVLGLATNLENFIPGLGLLDTFLSNVFGSAGIPNSAQLLATQGCTAIDAFTADYLNQKMVLGDKWTFGPYPRQDLAQIALNNIKNVPGGQLTGQGPGPNNIGAGNIKQIGGSWWFWWPYVPSFQFPAKYMAGPFPDQASTRTWINNTFPQLSNRNILNIIQTPNKSWWATLF
jgi:hypothetical protein